MTRKYVVMAKDGSLSVMDNENPKLNTPEFEMVDRLLSKSKDGQIYYSLNNKYVVSLDMAVAVKLN